MIVHEGNLSGAGIRHGIVAARFNETVVRTLVNGAVDVARRAGVADD
ncbi:MAG: 6,7-dimethyl-8-ribityllumazine synthase, partial [Actinobacteria bacterium]|nr:6,7-dimethyl-8-ribityllumazine synthase [Actinomycetota bacterium]